MKALLLFLLDLIVVLADLLGMVVWTAVGMGFTLVAGAAVHADGGPKAMAVMVISLSGVIVVALQLWLGLVLIPRYEPAGARRGRSRLIEVTA